MVFPEKEFIWTLWDTFIAHAENDRWSLVERGMQWEKLEGPKVVNNGNWGELEPGNGQDKDREDC